MNQWVLGMDFHVTTRLRGVGTTLVVLLALASWHAPVAPAAAAGSISGTAYQDLNRDGSRQAAEAAFSGHRVDLYDAADGFFATTLTDAAGHYEFLGLADGDY